MSELEDNDFEPEPQYQETQGSFTSPLKKRTADIYKFFTFDEKTKKWKCNYCM
jgi:hypothetical protein